MTPDPKPEARVKDPEMLRRFRLEHLGEPCQDCELRPGVHVHHVIFRSQRGSDTPDNLAWLCRPCHDARHGILAQAVHHVLPEPCSSRSDGSR